MDMQSKKLAGPKKGASTQQYLDISEIREEVVILKDKSLRAVLAVASINFALKGEDEQNALISGYAQFLNSLEQPLQIVIQSRKLNIDEYLGRLKVAEKQQTNDLLRMQITDYISFTRELVELGEIMSKRFYVVIPYSPISDKKKSFWSRLYSVFIPLAIAGMHAAQFTKYKQSLMQRVAHVQSGLSSLGLKSQLLDTQALMELYYSAYNPELAEVQKLPAVARLQVE